MSGSINSKVIGWLAYITRLQLICDGDSCLIAGSKEKLLSYIRQRNPDVLDKVSVAKARFGEIKRGLDYGAACSFDEKAYNRFYPLARQAGINVGPEDFSGETPTGLHFVRIQKMTGSKN